MKIGDLFYWKHRVLCEFIGIAKDGRYMFKTTNGGTNTLTRRLNGHCTGTFGKKCTHLASNWTRKRWPVTNWKPAFTGICTNTIICARIGRNWRNRYGRRIRTTVENAKPRPDESRRGGQNTDVGDTMR